MRIRIRIIPLVVSVIVLSQCYSTENDGFIMSVNGPVPVAEAGICLPHEHILVDFIGADSINDNRWNRQKVIQKALPYLRGAKNVGCRTFFECTPAYLGRDPLLLKKLSDTTGLNIITNTGYYGAGQDKYIPKHAFAESADEIAARWIAEWENGIGNTGIKPGFIKIGVGSDDLSDLHRKLIRAAARTHLKTGLTIASHTGLATPAFAQIGVLFEEGVSPEAFVWVHAQNEKNPRAHLMAAKLGAWISFDGIDDDNVNSYVQLIKNMKENYLLNKVLLSQDAGWYRPEEINGGYYRGYLTLFQKLIPQLKSEGFTGAEIHQLTALNPAKAFSVRIRKDK